MRRIPRLVSTTFLALAAASGARAQTDTDATLRADVEFARGLAADWGFTDLSERVLLDVEANAPEKMAEELALVKCEIYSAGARSEGRDVARRHELYEKALSSYQAFIDKFPYSELRTQAEAAFVTVTGEYGRSLAREMEAATGQEAETYKERLQERLTTAAALTGTLIEGLRAVEEPTEAEKTELYQLLLDRGDMLLEIAKSQQDGEFNFVQSQASYEELAFAAGEDHPYGLQAYVGMGNNLLAQSKFTEASDFFTFVCDKAIPKDAEVRNQWLRGELADQEEPPSAAALEQRFLFVQLALPGVVESLTKAGRGQEAADWALYFYNIYRGAGLSLYKGLGHLALLGVGRTLLDVGGFVGGDANSGAARWYATREEMEAAVPDRRGMRHSAADIALEIGTQVNSEMRGNVLQIRAQKLISDVLSLPGQKKDPKLLFDAAQGEYYSGNAAEAVSGFKELLAELAGADEALRTEFGTKTLYFLGKTYRRDGRHLQAIATYQEALVNWPSDIEHTEACANDMLASAGALRRTAKDDPLFAQLYKEAEDWVAKVGGNKEEDIKFRRALEEYDRASEAADYQSAMEAFAKVGPTAEDYELAKVYVGVSAFKLKDYAAAEKILSEYRIDFVNDPKNAVNTALARAKRKTARAMATLYQGFAATATAALASGAQREAAWRHVIEVLEGYEDEFPEQSSYAATAMFRRLMAHLELGETEAALAIHAELVKRYPDEKSTGNASVEAYKIVKGLWEEETDAAKKAEYLRQMARFLQITNESARTPSYNNMRLEAQHWIELGEYAPAVSVLERMRTAFSDDPANAENVTKFVLPDLGFALRKLKRVEEAAGVLAPIVETGTATLETARDYALCLTGWAEFDGAQLVEIVPGVAADSTGFEQGAAKLVQIVNTLTKWELPWYQAKFDLAMAYSRWSEIDSAKKQSAKAQLENVIPDLGGEGFPHIEDEAMRAQWVWLWQRVK